MPARNVFCYRVEGESADHDVVSLLEPDWVHRHGLRPEAVVGVAAPGSDLDRLQPIDFRENGTFLRLLSRVIHEDIGACEDLRREAELLGTGYVYLLDPRTPDPAGRVPPEDIIGAAAVADGHLVAGSYQHNPRHRLLTVHGWFGLPPVLEESLQRRLRARDGVQ